MPATEQTWRDSKLLHIVFGISGIAMLITTVWMLAADHNREWKPVQRKFREIETWFTQAKITDQDDAEFQQKKAELEKALADAQAQPPAESVVTAFLDEARPRVDENGYDLTKIESADAAVRELAQKSDEEGAQARMIAAPPRTSSRPWGT